MSERDSQSTAWQSIETAPKDGGLVWVKRVYDGRIVKEGEAVFASLHNDAPARSPLPLDPLNRFSAADYRREAEEQTSMVAQKHWLLPSRMYLFPTPTHWLPVKKQTP